MLCLCGRLLSPVQLRKTAVAMAVILRRPRCVRALLQDDIINDTSQPVYISLAAAVTGRIVPTSVPATAELTGFYSCPLTSLLHVAAICGSVPIANVLIEQGAELTRLDTLQVIPYTNLAVQSARLQRDIICLAMRLCGLSVSLSHCSIRQSKPGSFSARLPSCKRCCLASLHGRN